MPLPSPTTLNVICDLLGVAVPEGRGGEVFLGVAALEEATPGQISFMHGDKHAAAAMASKAGVILVPEKADFTSEHALRVPDVIEALIKVLNQFHPVIAAAAHRDPSAAIHPTAKIGKDVHLGAHVVVGAGSIVGDRTRLEAGTVVGANVSIGTDSRIGPNASILDDTQVGNRVQLHAGVVLGADGFRFEVVKGRPTKVPQVGRVVIGDDVEIGANSTIDRASFSETRIGARTKIDNQVHIGHNVIVGSDCILVAQVGIAGSAKLGRGVMIGGKGGVADHVTVGDGAQIAGFSAIHHDLPPRAKVIGVPAMPAKDFARFHHFQKNFGKHWEKIKHLFRDSEDQ
jgi:UDP-3-O-[3-hydroxymyristoyl] glucosamine N-acyltransferase